MTYAYTLFCYTIFVILAILPAFNQVESYESCKKKPDLSILTPKEQWFKEILGKNWTLHNTDPSGSTQEFYGNEEYSPRARIGFKINENGEFVSYGRDQNDVPTKESGCWYIKKGDVNIIMTVMLPRNEYNVEFLGYHNNNTLIVKILSK